MISRFIILVAKKPGKFFTHHARSIRSDRFDTEAMSGGRQQALIFEGEEFRLRAVGLLTKCDLFVEHPELFAKAYQVQSRVRPESFRCFVGMINGLSVQITAENVDDLSALSSEFAFQELVSDIDQWKTKNLSADGHPVCSTASHPTVAVGEIPAASALDVVLGEPPAIFCYQTLEYQVNSVQYDWPVPSLLPSATHKVICQ